ncbi:hypothetical protein [Novosphingobium sp. AP12]|uniref:hypothetical protein n=1 Tax=Novosphingobium sp. AP12 TaxID=1144305 RepID=UPI000271F18C|nr:hypothetical protein [Novosphingobium sp. AP12]EJL26504.1 hypothetical protein PMI02_03001 [Novosphingobium sp. AP12]
MARMAAQDGTAKPGRSYWVVAVLALVWNAFGCLDFSMTVTRNAAWLAPLPPEVIDWLDAAPVWSMFTWALGVWGGLLGALFLLGRSRLAVIAFAGSLLGLAINQIWQLTSQMPASMASPGSHALAVVIWAVALTLLWYAARKRSEGVLR